MRKQRFLRRRLTEAREGKGWGYTDMALELYKRGFRVAYNTLANWEAGKSTPRVEALIVIAETLGVPLGYFFAPDYNLSGEHKQAEQVAGGGVAGDR